MITATLCAVMRCGWHAHPNVLRFCQSHLFPLSYALVLFYCFLVSCCFFFVWHAFFMCLFKFCWWASERLKERGAILPERLDNSKTTVTTQKVYSKQAYNRREAALHTHTHREHNTDTGDKSGTCMRGTKARRNAGHIQRQRGIVVHTWILISKAAKDAWIGEYK